MACGAKGGDDVGAVGIATEPHGVAPSRGIGDTDAAVDDCPGDANRLTT